MALRQRLEVAPDLIEPYGAEAPAVDASVAALAIAREPTVAMSI